MLLMTSRSRFESSGGGLGVWDELATLSSLFREASSALCNGLSGSLNLAMACKEG